MHAKAKWGTLVGFSISPAARACSAPTESTTPTRSGLVGGHFELRGRHSTWGGAQRINGPFKRRLGSLSESERSRSASGAAPIPSLKVPHGRRGNPYPKKSRT